MCCISHTLCFLFAECHAKIIVYRNKILGKKKLARYIFPKLTIPQCVQQCIKRSICKNVQYHNHTCSMFFTRVTRRNMDDRESSMLFAKHRCPRKSRRHKHKHKHTKVSAHVDDHPSWHIIRATTSPPTTAGRYTLGVQGDNFLIYATLYKLSKQYTLY